LWVNPFDFRFFPDDIVKLLYMQLFPDSNT
jgi:hypothetical protein